MASDDPNIRAGQPPQAAGGRDLPPVRPPSGRFIAQLFLVPGLIVFFVVLLVVAINSMFVSGQSPEQFLLRLDSKTDDIRWRGANDLAQIIKRKESVNLRTDVGFGLDLSERLDKAVKTLDTEEAAIAESLKASGGTADANTFRKLEPQRNLVNFLAASLGAFEFPAGAPILSDMIAKPAGPDAANGKLRRYGALWSLNNLGANLKKFKTLKQEHQSLILAKLRTEVDSKNDVRRRAAKNALFYLGEFPDAKDPDLVAIDGALDTASRDQDQYLRELSAMALNFWDGPLAVGTLVRLSRDNGFGTPPEEYLER